MRRESKVKSEIVKIIEQGRPIHRAVARAAREAVLVHQRAGLPLAVWRRGRVMHVPAATYLPKKGR